MEPNRLPAVQNLIVIPRCKNSRCFLPSNLVLGYLSLTKLPSSSAFKGNESQVFGCNHFPVACSKEPPLSRSKKMENNLSLTGILGQEITAKTYWRYNIISYHILGESEDISLKSSKFRIHLRLFWEEWKELQRQGVLWTCNQRVTQWNTAEAAAAAIALHELLLGIQDILVKSWTTRNITNMCVYIYILSVLSDTWCFCPFLLLWVSISNLRAVSIFWAFES